MFKKRRREYYEKEYFSGVVTTNLTYQTPELKSRPYYYEADMTAFLGTIIDYLNHDVSIGGLMDPTERIRDMVDKYNNNSRMFLKN